MLIAKMVNYLKKKYKTRRFLDSGQIGEKTQFGPMSNCFNSGGTIIIGDNCDIHAVISVKKGARIIIKDHTTIRYNTKIGAVESIEIGSHCIISNNVTIYDNNNHPIDPQIRWEMCESGFFTEKWEWYNSSHKSIIIEDNVWVGEGATILKSVKIGRGAIVACHAVVTKDVDPYCIVAGNPAVWVKNILAGGQNV